uniref:15-hydroxyprostaglandin dehydrogenase n=1 Tax=Oryzias latipes TaxID=8090 RepID=A0A3P9LPJ0_ORYLA
MKTFRLQVTHQPLPVQVVLLDVDEPTGKRLKNGLDQQFGEERSLFMKCSVESDEDIKAALQSTIDTFGSINILCNNAGILREGDWEKTISINLGGVIRMTYAALEHMNKLSGGQGGVVVNTSSVAGLDPLPSCPAYSATKHGVVAFTRAMAAASRASEYGIRFNVVCPVRVQTDISSPQFLKTLDSSPTCLVPCRNLQSELWSRSLLDPFTNLLKSIFFWLLFGSFAPSFPRKYFIEWGKKNIFLQTPQESA